MREVSFWGLGVTISGAQGMLMVLGFGPDSAWGPPKIKESKLSCIQGILSLYIWRDQSYTENR